MNHLGILLKCKLSFGRPGVGPRFCISHEFPGERDTADPQAELSGTLSKEGLDPDHSLQPHLSPGLYLALLSLESSLGSSKHTRFQPVSRPATHCTLYLDCSFLPPLPPYTHIRLLPNLCSDIHTSGRPPAPPPVPHGTSPAFFTSQWRQKAMLSGLTGLNG